MICCIFVAGLMFTASILLLLVLLSSSDSMPSIASNHNTNTKSIIASIKHRIVDTCHCCCFLFCLPDDLERDDLMFGCGICNIICVFGL